MNTNYETTAVTPTPEKSTTKNIIIGVLAAAVVGLGIYTTVDHTNSGEQIQQQQTALLKATDEKSTLQSNFDASLARLDSMSTENKTLEGKLTASNTTISKMKTEIRSILNKRNASAAELSKAKILIGELNEKISTMEADIARLTQDNETLTADKVALTADKEKLTADLTTTVAAKEELATKVNIASTLNASNIKVTPIDVKGEGKEKQTAKAKRVDKLLITFDVDNRIATTGTTDVFVMITGPDGQVIKNEATGSGTFTTREEGEKTYTAKVPVEVETAKRKNVAFGFVPGNTFQKGNYKVQIYQNGFLIGEGTAELKKGGLFG